MNEAPKSGERAVSLDTQAREVVASLRALRGRAAEFLQQLDAVLENAEAFVALGDHMAHVTWDLADTGAAHERASLRIYGRHGELVTSIAEARGVPLRDVLGPGAPRTPAAAEARGAAIDALFDAHLSASDIARVMNVSFEAARRRVAARRAAA